MKTEDRYMLTTALAAAFNLLILLVLCFHVGPLVQKVSDDLDAAARRNYELLLGLHQISVDIKVRSERLDDRLSKVDADRREWQASHAKMHESLSRVLDLLGGKK